MKGKKSRRIRKQVSNPASMGKRKRVKAIQETIERKEYVEKEAVINHFAVELGLTIRKVKEYIRQLKRSYKIEEKKEIVNGETVTFLTPFEGEKEIEEEEKPAER